METKAFLERWSASGASERANKDLFLSELCDVLGLPRPEPESFLRSLPSRRSRRSLERQPPSRPSPGRGRGSDSEVPSPDDHSTTGGGTGRGRPGRRPASPRPPWPKTLPEQIGAVRDLVLGSERAWTAEAVARSFHRAQVKTVEPVLDSLSAIGVLVALDGDGGRQWKGAGK